MIGVFVIGAELGRARACNHRGVLTVSLKKVSDENCQIEAVQRAIQSYIQKQSDYPILLYNIQ